MVHASVVVLLSLVVTTSSLPYAIINIDKSPGIYYEYVGSLKYASVNWKIVTTIDLEEIRIDTYDLLNQIKDIKEKCPSTPQKCKLHFSQLAYLTGKIGTANRTLQDLINVAQNIKETLEITTNKRVTNGITDRVRNLNNLKWETYALYNLTRENKHIFTEGYLTITNRWMETLRSNLNAHIEAYRNTINIIRSAQKGNINEYLITETEFERIEERKNQRKINSEFAQINPYVADANKIIKTKIGRTETTIQIKIEIPLFPKVNYNLYKMYSVPVPQDYKVSAYIKPKLPYIAINEEKGDYTLLSSTDLQECYQSDSNIYCPPPPEIYTKPTCETKILTNSKNIDLQDCDIQTKRLEKTEWIYLNHNDEWIYSTQKDQNVLIECKDKSKMIHKIQGIGTLHLDPGCTATTSDIRLQPKSSTIKEHFHFSPSIGLTTTTTTTTTTTISTTTKSPIIYELKNKLKETNIDIYYLKYMVYILLSFGIITLIIAGILVGQIRKQQTPNTFNSVTYSAAEPVNHPEDPVTNVGTPEQPSTRPALITNTPLPLPPIHRPISTIALTGTPTPRRVTFNLDPNRIKQKNTPLNGASTLTSPNLNSRGPPNG